jgi:hypothetical protein
MHIYVYIDIQGYICIFICIYIYMLRAFKFIDVVCGRRGAGERLAVEVASCVEALRGLAR